MGFDAGLFLILGCFLEFVWLLLWLWKRFFNMFVTCAPFACGFEKKKRNIRSVFLFCKTTLCSVILRQLFCPKLCGLSIARKSSRFVENIEAFCLG